MVQSDNIYLTAHDNRLYSLDLNGVERWSVSLVADEHDLRNESPCSLCVDNNGNIYVNVRNMGDDYIISLHSNGSFRWYYKFGVSVESNPTIGPNGRIYVVSYDWIEDDGGILFSLNQQGEVEWTCEIDGWAISFSPVLGPDGTIYIGTVDGILYSISPEGTLKWKYTCGNSIEMPSIGSDGTIYFGLGEVYRDDDDGEGSIVALSSNGKQKWKTQLGKLEPYQPAIGTNGYLYVGTGRGFYALGDQTFDEFLTPGFECTSMIMIVGFIIVSLKKRGKGARSR